MFAGFEKQTRRVNGVDIAYRMGGNGPALLLLHGHPQTHMIWHKVAGMLAQHFTVIAADLRGYGDSGKPDDDAEHFNYAKRTMAADMAELMSALGFERFKVLAHDRGARVAHRLGVDHAARVERMVLLDIAPTLAMYRGTNEAFARSYWHWFFLIRPQPLPEMLIQADPAQYLKSVMGARSAGMAPFAPEALAEYERCLALPGTATGICGDYRASATIDLEHDQADIDAGVKLTCPINVMWGAQGAIEACFDALGEWRKVATQVEGKALPCGHYIAEEIPDVLLEEVLPFLLDPQ
ncbi:MAG: alpha/beta hydrolase [Halomonas sp.]|jgi:haloacetate dehalogenase|uniref:alpha/beta fold hydrolase n=1 Tax=Vreelandella aquamarina TaxID=77097 RepID=UPI0007336201|nr:MULTISPECIES: alpha/beta hydrolase [Halomonas]KTG27404.1 alpha/beta hydrolase [Idiomarina sp. H105]MDK2750436.1 alpha/beta hydrolase [Halomonas meridiana]NQY76348.1 alpha/beta hydrolase [Halomonas sp.]OAF03480.1 alpha/beta hydrolase [Idiomarina sp. WRN-38]